MYFPAGKGENDYQHSSDIKANNFLQIYHLYELKRQVILIENLFYPNNLMAQLPHFKVASSPGHTETELSHETNLY